LSDKAFLALWNTRVVAGIVRFALADGETIDVRRDDLRLIYEELWQLVNEPGALSTAAVVLHESRQDVSSRPIALTDYQSALLRAAVTRLGLEG